MAAKNKTSELAKLRQVESTERRRAREAALAASAARTDADEARGQLVEAHADGDVRGIKVAEGARAQAVACAEGAAIADEGAEMRLQRAAETTQAFEVENSRELLAELAPAGDAAAARLEHSAQELIVANGQWQAIAQRASELLIAMPNASPAADAPSGHVLEAVTRDVRKALEQGDVASPLPHYRGLQHLEGEQERVKELRQRREQAS